MVVAAQSFHWFDVDKALPEIARVLKPEGTLALVWNDRDERIPWVQAARPAHRHARERYGATQSRRWSTHGSSASSRTQTFRHWQPLRKQELRDLVLSRSNIAVMQTAEQERVLREVDALYDDYGRGPDGLLMPYVTHCFKAVVRPVVLEESGPIHLPTPAEPKPDEDDGTPLFSLS